MGRKRGTGFSGDREPLEVQASQMASGIDAGVEAFLNPPGRPLGSLP